MIKIAINNINKIYHESEYYKSFDKVEESNINEEIEIPKQCYTDNLDELEMNEGEFNKFERIVNIITYWDIKYVFKNETYYEILENKEEAIKIINDKCVQYNETFKFIMKDYEKEIERMNKVFEIYYEIYYEIQMTKNTKILSQILVNDMDDIFKNLVEKIGKKITDDEIYSLKIVAATLGKIEITEFLQKQNKKVKFGFYNKRLFAGFSGQIEYIKYYDANEKNKYNSRRIYELASFVILNDNIDVVKHYIKKCEPLATLHRISTKTYLGQYIKKMIDHAIYNDSFECFTFLTEHFNHRPIIDDILKKEVQLNKCIKSIVYNEISEMDLSHIINLYESNKIDIYEFIVDMYNLKENSYKMKQLIKYVGCEREKNIMKKIFTTKLVQNKKMRNETINDIFIEEYTNFKLESAKTLYVMNKLEMGDNKLKEFIIENIEVMIKKN